MMGVSSLPTVTRSFTHIYAKTQNALRNLVSSSQRGQKNKLRACASVRERERESGGRQGGETGCQWKQIRPLSSKPTGASHPVRRSHLPGPTGAAGSTPTRGGSTARRAAPTASPPRGACGPPPPPLTQTGNPRRSGRHEGLSPLHEPRAQRQSSL